MKIRDLLDEDLGNTSAPTGSPLTVVGFITDLQARLVDVAAIMVLFSSHGVTSFPKGAEMSA